jgi:hypothetical protein
LSKINKTFIISLLSILGIIVSYILFFFLEFLIIPDACYYEMHDTNWFIDLLFVFPGWNGFHPYPSNFQFSLIFGFGIYLAFIFSKKVLKI